MMYNEKRCNHCGTCTRNCPFLQKYQMDVSGLHDTQHHNECMLCGRCAQVCPLGLDGAAIVMSRRRSAQRFSMKTMPVVFEKKRYLFRRYSGKAGDSMLFPGCYFPAFFPKTMAAVLEIADQKQMTFGFDCCGKPLHEMGREMDSVRVLDHIETQLKKRQVKELVTVCPNCYGYLDNRISLPVVTIYDKLADWGYQVEALTDGCLFPPCPERKAPELREHIDRILPLQQLRSIEQVPCCGLGGGAASFAGDTVDKLIAEVKRQTDGRLYTYCASCAGHFHRRGISPVRHLLAEILGIDEAPDVAHSIPNRIRNKIR